MDIKMKCLGFTENF